MGSAHPLERGNQQFKPVAGGAYAPITNPAELVWYAPALGANPYESIENYKTGAKDGFLPVEGTNIAFTVPLYGQPDGSVATMYAFRARAFSKRGSNVIGVSEWCAPFFVQARPTSAADVVKAWKLNDKGEKVKVEGALGAKQIFVEDLAAITANLGLITDGGLRGSKYNYWAVSDTHLPDGSYLYRGAFRVGGAKQFIEVTPILDAQGKPTGEYNINFVVNDFTVSSTGARIAGKTFEVFDKDGQLLFSVSPEGSKIFVKEGFFRSADPKKNALPLPAPVCSPPFDPAFIYNGDYYAILSCGEAGATAVFKNETLAKLIPAEAEDDFRTIAAPHMTYPTDDGLLYLPYKRAHGSDSAMMFRVLNLNTLAVQGKAIHASYPKEPIVSGCYKEYLAVIGGISDGNRRVASPIMIFNLKTNKTITAPPLKMPVADFVFNEEYLYLLHPLHFASAVSRLSLKTGECRSCVFRAAIDWSDGGPGIRMPGSLLKKTKDAILMWGPFSVFKSQSEGVPSAAAVIKLPDAAIKWLPAANIDRLTEQDLTIPWAYLTQSPKQYFPVASRADDFFGIAFDASAPGAEGKDYRLTKIELTDAAPQNSYYCKIAGTLAPRVIGALPSIYYAANIVA